MLNVSRGTTEGGFDLCVFWDARRFPVIPLLLDGFVGQLRRLLTPYHLGITNMLNKQLAELRGAPLAPGSHHIAERHFCSWLTDRASKSLNTEINPNEGEKKTPHIIITGNTKDDRGRFSGGVLLV